MLPNFAYIRVRSLDEAIEHLSTEGARIHAGGTDLLGCLREQVFEAKKVVSISGLNSLRGIRETVEGGLRIGSLTTVSEVAKNPFIRKGYTALAQAASEVASPQLRNQGTIGGNICQKPRCWYYRGEFHCVRKGGDVCYAIGGESQYHCIFGGDMCYIVHPSDTAPALTALGAMVHLAGPKGKRSVPIEKFFVLPSQNPERETVLEVGELVTEIELPPPRKGLRSAYRKVRARRSWDFALAGAALALSFDGNQISRARVVLSGAAPVPWRSEQVEKILVGNELDEELAAKAANTVIRGAQPLDKNGYKISLFSGLIEEELLAMAGS